jgi:hypothetical protein
LTEPVRPSTIPLACGDARPLEIGGTVKSWEVLREAVEQTGVKAIAAKLGVSTALVYKWCQESPDDDPDSSGARNPLDRLATIYHLTRDTRSVNWLCQEAGGFFTKNPSRQPGAQEAHLLGTTQQVVNDFGGLLAEVSRSIANDGVISRQEADRIRESWEKLKGQTECFVLACEQGLYEQIR